MKQFKLTPEVLTELEGKIKELAKFCKANSVPFVSAYLAGCESQKADKLVSLYLDRDNDLAPDFLRAMSAIAQSSTLGEGIIKAVMMSGLGTVADISRIPDDDQAPDQCPCPECELARSSQQPDEPPADVPATKLH